MNTPQTSYANIFVFAEHFEVPVRIYLSVLLPKTAQMTLELDLILRHDTLRLFWEI